MTCLHDGDANVVVSTVVERLLGPSGVLCGCPLQRGRSSQCGHTQARSQWLAGGGLRDSRPQSGSLAATQRKLWCGHGPHPRSPPSVSSGILLNKYLLSSYGPNNGRKAGWQCGPPS